ncbi:unnamed protein product [Symbiodinium natans]|uniref:START domain-containing protein n=1 Tax=Symbiodinium natans TaxID=878477 RepID=A0A812UKC7_9DINO|nr:unnamed protein product [Symbiodinium natans]
MGAVIPGNAIVTTLRSESLEERQLQSLEKLVRAMPAEKDLQRKADGRGIGIPAQANFPSPELGAARQARALRSLLEDLKAGRKVEASAGCLAAAEPIPEEQEESVRHVASFLRLDSRRQKPEDDVRLLAAEGTLSEELSKYPVLACAEGSAVFLRSWGEEDDHEENERRRLAVLELSQAATNLQEIIGLMPKQLAADQESLDAAEAQVAHTKDVTEKTVVILAEAAGHKQTQWVLPSLAITLVGGAAVLTCPAAAAARGMLLVGSSMVSYKALSTIQHAVITQLKDQLPRAFEPLPEEKAKMIRAGSEEARDRLQRKLDESGRWKEESLLQRLRKVDLLALRREVLQTCTVHYAKSDARVEGKAYAVSFTVALPPVQAFRVLQRNVTAGSIDPACKVMWSRPVDSEDGSVHSIRYLAFTDWFVGRDFCCTCFCGKVPRDDGVECYALAMTSLGKDLLDAEGLPKPDPGLGRGRIYVSGVRFTAVPEGTRVEVMADTDPDAPLGYLTRIIDKRVRSHACDVAFLLQRELSAAGHGQVA